MEVKTALRVFTYSYINIYDKQYSHDKKVLKPYKGNGVVLMNKIDYDEEAMVLWQNEI